MAKILNLDELVIAREIVLKGKTRKLNSMSVEQFIASDDLEARAKAAEKPGERVALMVDQILSFMEDTTREELVSMSLDQLFAILAFIRGTDSDGNPAGVAKATEGNVESPKSS